MAGRIPGLVASAPSGGWGFPPTPGTPSGPQQSTGFPPSLANTPVITAESDPHEKGVAISYVAKPMRDLSHRQLKDFQFVFALRAERKKAQHVEGLTPMLHLGQVNNKLASLYILGSNTLFAEPGTESPLVDLVALDELRRLSSDMWYVGENALHLMDPIEKNQRSLAVKFLSAEGILRTFNPLGVIQNLMGGNDVAFAQASTDNTIHDVNVIVKNIAYVMNYWGKRAIPGTDLYLILKRRYNKETAQYGEFAFVPYVCQEDATPPLSDLHYIDHTGKSLSGHAYYVGFVLDHETPVRDNGLSLRAAGLTDGTIDMQTACDTLDAVLKIQIRPSRGSKSHFIV